MHFTADDLLRTHFVSAPAPLLELALALAVLRRRDAPAFAAWRARLRRRFPADARPMLQLAPVSGAGPAFLDPVSDSVEHGIDLVRSARTEFVRKELDRVLPSALVTPWLRRLAARDPAAWRVLIAAVRAAYDGVLAADWQRVLASHRGDLAYRSRLVAQVGLQDTIAGMYPGARWDGSTLSVPCSREADEYPGGAGVALLPSAFWTGRPLVTADREGSLCLIYPAITPLPLICEQSKGDRLAALLGRTRADVLRALASEHTTSQLADELGISAAAASEHAKTLRANGLIVTERAGKSVLHSCTLLGLRLQAGV